MRWSVPHVLERSDGKSGKSIYEAIMEMNDLGRYLKDLDDLFDTFWHSRH